MKRVLVGLFVAAWSVASASPAVNPLCRLFPDDISLLLSFDDGSLQPDIGAVPPERGPLRHETSEGGVLGRCLSAGGCDFRLDQDGRPLMDVTSSGTVLCWVRYVQDVPAGKNPGITWFIANMKPSDGCTYQRLLMMKQQNADSMNAFYEHVTDKRRAVSANRPCSYRHWKKGEWTMCAMTWTPDRIGLSLNGAPVYELAYDRKFGPVASLTFKGPHSAAADRFYQIDECAVLTRKLTDAELKRVYEAFAKVGNLGKSTEGEVKR